MFTINIVDEQGGIRDLLHVHTKVEPGTLSSIISEALEREGYEACTECGGWWPTGQFREDDGGLVIICPDCQQGSDRG